MKTSWYCLMCDRALSHETSKAHDPLDTVTAPTGSTYVIHDQCGGRVAWSERDLKQRGA